MKTLHEEVVEALRGARIANFYLPSICAKYDELAKKVESTHCTNCDKYIHDKHFPGCSIFDVDDQDVAFSCEEFKLKVT